MFNFYDKSLELLHLIEFKRRSRAVAPPYIEDEHVASLPSNEIVFFNEDVQLMGVTREIFYDLLAQLKGMGFVQRIIHLALTDEGAMDWFTRKNLDVRFSYLGNDSLVVQLSDDFAKKYKAIEKQIVKAVDKIGERESGRKKSNEAVAYEARRDEFSREISVNGKPLSKPDFMSENDLFAEYVFANPNRPLSIIEITRSLERELKKRPLQIIKDLGFEGSLRKLFFPDVSANGCRFVNPITMSFLEKSGITKIEGVPKLRKSGRTRINTA